MCVCVCVTIPEANPNESLLIEMSIFSFPLQTTDEGYANERGGIEVGIRMILEKIF